ncbi:NIF system FeS cluster assembly, NifU-like scaffold, N-terminal [Pseudocohnilembus persalinus]|uniref:NIF system FeS cluster assembly, NifU-like scaffold, N-terminal n=1 Tax=Pseudocohnilembus persalinus TaxID=266149 RepID=A0A0V0QXV3_PSEPJ|nr:NIF system FeS cluster assembly, NifU-like scaffold, N-terminal [Pseudocohnilembus persalinus]|eukprot:KRX07180.1 NIF system FeS cluster assembly, NifU-like scaffold, N-terminal [Pseudocohnilembus persalinus]
MESGTMDFVAPRFTHISPMARELFNVDGVTRVFYGKDYISISKVQDVSWGELKPQIFQIITEQFEGFKPLFTDQPESEDTKINEDDSEAVQFIKEILDNRIRPSIQEDGGDIVYRSFDEENGIVHLYLKGSCTSCPSSENTLKFGIEKMLKHYVAEVNEVQATDYSGQEQEAEQE